MAVASYVFNHHRVSLVGLSAVYVLCTGIANFVNFFTVQPRTTSGGPIHDQASEHNHAQASTTQNVDVDVIMGFATGYEIASIHTFVHSIRATGYSGAILLGIHSWTTRHVQLGKRYEVLFKIVPRSTLRKRGCYSCTVSKDILRFYCFKTWLRQQTYRNVFVSDVRDVIFQSNIFEKFQPERQDTLYIYEESYNFTNWQVVDKWVGYLKTNPYLQHDDDNINGTRHMIPVCIGATLGTQLGTLTYLNSMTALLDLTKRECPVLRVSSKLIPGCCYCHKWGFDQAMVNYMLQAGMLPSVTKVRYGQGSVLTVGLLSTSDVKMDDLGFLANDMGERAAAIHQYDRLPGFYWWHNTSLMF
eukprot:CAMPEP_0114243208 /NCGR_PEP_ID=MMETSP0058-20121206/10656_1 /TAXON_ID=36894 /ORGANISM="Pyramimonas parkeae, CCMP726" /LENGTH=357 /DNA_ID=CAMNT_0001356011 /DNA_START=1074 /DNA_END=2147 /DNA_ORIENTATION=-